MSRHPTSHAIFDAFKNHPMVSSLNEKVPREISRMRSKELKNIQSFSTICFKPLPTLAHQNHADQSVRGFFMKLLLIGLGIGIGLGVLLASRRKRLPASFSPAHVSHEQPGSQRDPEERPVDEHDKAELREKMLDKTLADSFPTSDPPSSIPDPSEDDSLTA